MFLYLALKVKRLRKEEFFKIAFRLTVVQSLHVSSFGPNSVASEKKIKIPSGPTVVQSLHVSSIGPNSVASEKNKFKMASGPTVVQSLHFSSFGPKSVASEKRKKISKYLLGPLWSKVCMFLQLAPKV